MRVCSWCVIIAKMPLNQIEPLPMSGATTAERLTEDPQGALSRIWENSRTLKYNMFCGHSLKWEQCQKNKIIERNWKCCFQSAGRLQKTEILRKRLIKKVYSTNASEKNWKKSKNLSLSRRDKNKHLRWMAWYFKKKKKKDSTPLMEHFILTFCLQECWHHLNSAGVMSPVLHEPDSSSSQPSFLCVLVKPLRCTKVLVCLAVSQNSWLNHPQALQLQEKNFPMIRNLGINLDA